MVTVAGGFDDVLQKVRRSRIGNGEVFALAVRRRNWLFSDTVGGANASANLYSLLQACKVNAVDSYRYLVASFTALPLAKTADDYEALLPWRIALPAACVGGRAVVASIAIAQLMQGTGSIDRLP